MARKTILNPFTRKLDFVESIPQLNSDPASPTSQSAWVLKTAGGGGTGGGVYKGTLGLGFPYLSKSSGGGSATYQLSYRTIEGTTKRVSLS